MRGITSEAIHATHSTPGYNRHEELHILEFHRQLKNEAFTLPKWQRPDRWPEGWSKKLIECIMLNSDIPKLYITNIKDSDIQYLIDGGHRARSIRKFIENKFSITIDGVEVFYDKPRKPSRQNRGMTSEEKEIFNNYKLSITYYTDLTEQEARNKFNDLQNAQPMTMADVVNSHESPLVDYLRDYVETITHPDHHKFKAMCNLSSFPCTKNKEGFVPEMIYRFASLYSMNFPDPLSYGFDEKKTYSMCSVLEGKTRESPCYKYIYNHDDTIEEHERSLFTEFIDDFIKLLSEWKSSNGINVSTSIANSLYHAMIYIHNFSSDKFLAFIKTITEIGDKKKLAVKKNKEKKYDDAKRLNTEADALAEPYGEDIEIWEKSKRNGGSDYTAMNIRYNIIVKYCIE